MKKMLIAAALCAGIFAFANADVVEAAVQQQETIYSLEQGTTIDMQQTSTRNKNKYGDDD